MPTFDTQSPLSLHEQVEHTRHVQVVVIPDAACPAEQVPLRPLPAAVVSVVEYEVYRDRLRVIAEQARHIAASANARIMLPMPEYPTAFDGMSNASDAIVHELERLGR